MKLPDPVRAVAFFDGQNLFHCAKKAFGYSFPNYDPLALAREVCTQKGWQLTGSRFYTGVPDAGDNAFWNHFWVAKGAQMGAMGFMSTRVPYDTETRPLSCPTATNIRSWTGTKRVSTFVLPWTLSDWRMKTPTTWRLFFVGTKIFRRLPRNCERFQRLITDGSRWRPLFPTVRRTRFAALIKQIGFGLNARPMTSVSMVATIVPRSHSL